MLTVAAVLLAVCVTSLGADTPAAEGSTTADVKITSVTVGTLNGANQCVNPLPTEIPVSTNVQICVRTTFHNNGPLQPVDLSLTRSWSFVPAEGQAANECLVSHSQGFSPPHVITFNNTNASVTLTRTDNYTISCTRPSFHTFRFTSSASANTGNPPQPVPDPVPDNNIASQDVTFGITAESDIEIVSQVLRGADCVSDPPAVILANTDNVFCVAKALHNFGPYGPAAVDIFFRGLASADCTINGVAPPNVATATRGVQLQVSVATVIYEYFTIRCTQPSNHTFQIENITSPHDVHVSDPDADPFVGEYALTGHAVAVFAQSDVKITSQSLSGPATMTPGVPFELTLNKTIHNNGPEGPLAVDITPTVTKPADCTVTPDGNNPASANLSVSNAVPVQEKFS
ncbi:MAG TPA: hypothetical protein VMR52_07065, partial [Dehalococcoidia bacterium]|nr:hypothetical protein [Dehalococcoidia bacterium]